MMSKKLIFILMLFCSLKCFGQLDFSIFLDKKEMKKAYGKLFHNFSSYGELVCVKGDCKNGPSILKVTNGSQFRLLIIGNFRNKMINGEAVFLNLGVEFLNKFGDFQGIYEVFEANTSNFRAIQEAYKNKIYESYYGLFKENVLVDKGVYYLTAEIQEIIKNPKYDYKQMARLMDIPLVHFDFLDQTLFSNTITYEYRGKFIKEVNGHPQYSLESPMDYIVIKTSEFPKIIIKADSDPNIKYKANYFNKFDMLTQSTSYRDDDLSSALLKKQERAKEYSLILKEKERKEKEAEIARIIASSSCKVLGEWISTKELPKYSGRSVCKKNGELVPFSWEHPLTKKVSGVISHFNDHYNGANGYVIYFPKTPFVNPGTYKIYAIDTDIEERSNKIFVTSEFNHNQYDICGNCHGTGQFYIGDNNPNIMRSTYGWFLGYTYYTSWKRESGSALIPSKSRKDYLDEFKKTGTVGLTWKEELKEGLNMMPCMFCKGMGCLLK